MIRIYIQHLHNNKILLNHEQSHYLTRVMRLKSGDHFHVFNHMDGEHKAKLSVEKKEAYFVCQEKISDAFIPHQKLALVFSPIKQDRLSFLIEKATELGVTDFYPVSTQHGQITKINPIRLQKIMQEAVEQSERFTIPKLHMIDGKLHSLRSAVHQLNNDGWEVYSAIERSDAHQPIQSRDQTAIVIGPEGGFSEAEKGYLDTHTKKIFLSEFILRAETAALSAISKLI